MRTTTNRTIVAAAAVALAAGLLAGCASAEDGAAATSPTPSGSQSMSQMPAMPEGASSVVGNFALAGVWVKESSLDLSAGFGSITNNANEDDALIGASAPGVPMIEMHETVDGVMQQVESFPVLAGGTLDLAPGGNHLMFMGLTEPLKAGGTIDVTLKFESGATATITAPIEPFTVDDGHGEM